MQFSVHWSQNEKFSSHVGSLARVGSYWLQGRIHVCEQCITPITDRVDMRMKSCAWYEDEVMCVVRMRVTLCIRIGLICVCVIFISLLYHMYYRLR